MNGAERSRSRRGFLKQALSIAPLAAMPEIALAVPRSSDPPQDLDASAPAPSHPAEPDYRPSFFDATEWAFLLAACERLIPGDAIGPGAVEVGVPQYIDRQMGTPWAEGALWYMQGPFFETIPELGYQSQLTPRQQYRLSIKAINALCRESPGRDFVQLTHAQQHEVLHRIESGEATSTILSLQTFFKMFLLQNTLEGFFCDPMYGGNKGMAGWRMIRHPGARADFLDFVGRAEPYPFGPVSIYGERA